MRFGFLAATAACVVLAACSDSDNGNGGGSGSGGGTPGGGGTAAFTGFSNVPDDATVALDGTTLTVPLSTGANNSVVAGEASAAGDVDIEYVQADGEVTRISGTIGGRAVDFNASAGSTIETRNGVIVASKTDGSERLEIAAPATTGFEYQTYGGWSILTGADRSFRPVSAGSETAAANLPSGAATYTGKSTGFATLPSGQTGLTRADVTLSTENFRDMRFTATNTELSPNGGTTAFGREEGLDLFGSMTVDGSSFSGAVRGRLVAGGGSGQFYGPNAEEVGGVFSASGDRGYSYTGSFGASR